jgi:CheY-like chemotaxis protein
MNPDGRVVAVVVDAAVCESTRFFWRPLVVITYLNGDDFVRDDPDIACLNVDYHTPRLNGLEFVSELRKRGRQPPAIMITATADPTIERRAAELGINRVLQKSYRTKCCLA